MNPIEISNDIIDTYFRYITTRFPLGKTDPLIRENLRELLYSEKEKLIKGPILELMPPYKKARSLRQLSQDYPIWNLFLLHFDKIENKNIDLDRPLYLHQEKALIKSLDKNLVIASGTGSGKTECFLFPIIKYCLEKPGRGVRAILIYPLNALVEDQIIRLKEYLSGTCITFGKYTGQTPNELGKLNNSNPNHLTSREEMRANPPNILITNYSMLEYMLLRPGDSPIIDSGDEYSFKYIVLDEAHTYSGAQGTEVAFLLKRLRYRVSKKHNEIRYIATSATLGAGKDTISKTVLFANRLFGASFDEDSIITGEKEMLSEYLPQKIFDKYKFNEILDWGFPNSNTTSEVIKQKFLISTNESNLQKIIYDELKGNVFVRKMISFLEGSPTLLGDLSKKIFPNENQEEANQAIVNMVAWADYAKDINGRSLLPARYHMFVSATKGLFCELAASGSSNFVGSLSLSQKEIRQKVGNPYPFELGVCKICGEPYIMGVFVCDNKGKKHYKPIADSFFETLDSEDSESEKVILSYKNISNSKPVSICRKCAKVGQQCEHSESEKITLYLISSEQTLYNDEEEEINDEEFQNNVGCINCHSGKSVSKNILPFRFPANGSATPVVSTLYSHCPDMDEERIDHELNELNKEYGIRNPDWTPIISKGKKLLVFSDSRQEAAFFGPYLQVSHLQLVFSRFMIDILKSKSTGIDINEWRDIANNRLRIYYNSKELSAILIKELKPTENLTYEIINNNNTRIQRIYHSILHLIDRTASSISGLEGIGIAAVYFDDPQFAKDIILSGLSKENIYALAQLILRYIRLQEAFYLTPEEDISLSGTDGSDTYFGYRYQKIILINKDDNNKGEQVVRLISSTKKTNQLQEQVRYVIARIMGTNVTIEEVNKVITVISTKFIGKELKAGPKGVGFQLNINALRIMPANPDNGEFPEPILGGLPRFKACKKCGRLSWINIKGICNYPNCYGELEDPDISLQFSKNNHYRNILFEREKFPELRAVEHTAQLNKTTTAREYQDEFKRGRINVLSCSTTFEMGVDLGDLSIIFMKNIPPAISNYVQRAGRAGRRVGISPFVLTFCRSLPHDQYFFKNYEKMVKGEVNPPALVLENEKIIRRHYNAVILSDFLKKYKAAFNFVNVDYSKDPLLHQLFETSQEFNNLLPSSLSGLSPSQYLCNVWLPNEIENYKLIFKNIFFDDLLNNKFSNKSIENYLVFFVNDEKYGLQANIEKRYIEEVTYYKNERNKNDPKIETQLKDFYYFHALLKQTREEQLISHLSSHGFLPSYAFPTNVVPLYILSDKKDAKQLDLNRNLDRAISEYAPGSTIVANSRLYTSGAVQKYPKQEFKKIFYFNCRICNRFINSGDKNILQNKIEEHINFHKIPFDPNNHKMENSIYPAWGFAVPRNKDSDRIRPNTKLEKSGYSSELFIDIDGFTGEHARKIYLPKRGYLEVELANGYNIYRINPGKISNSIKNKSGFIICSACGRALVNESEKHKTPYGGDKNKYCECRDSLSGYHLISIFDTDIVKIKFNDCPLIPKEILEERDYRYKFKSFWRSILYSFLESISRTLEIERNDIDGLFIPSINSKFAELVLLDSVSGGAGHVSRLVGKGGEDPQTIFTNIITAAKLILDCKDCAENTACYSCLFHHSNQKVQHTLNRGLALEWVNKL